MGKKECGALIGYERMERKLQTWKSLQGFLTVWFLQTFDKNKNTKVQE